jgi:CRP-like cAMP-binding protein
MNDEKTALIKFIQQAIPLDHDMARAIADHFHTREWKKGDLFLKEGKISNEYIFLNSGFMRAFLFDTEGNEVTVHFYSPYNIVFEIASFFQRVPSQENIQALTDSTGWALTYEQLNNLFHTIPAFRDFGRAVLVKYFAALKIRTLSMINKTAEQRYEVLLASNPEIFQNASLKHIASYLGITDSSLSRIRAAFSRK